ncbi:MAG: hypothetical protein AAFV88_20565 [Planctomycetota bacterium]
MKSVAAALVACAGLSAGVTANDTFVVGSQVISDTVAPASGFVGDLSGEVQMTGCASGDCGASVGDCSSGSCGGDCSSGSCGGDCEDGRCGLGGRLGGRLGCKGCTDVGCQGRKYDQPDLFYNFYSKGNCNSANAQMYISPLPVPHFVGHTFNTYQPFYPHEFMYWHKNKYHNTYDNGRGMNRTRALYYAPPIKTAVSNLYWNKLRLPR